ncbi:MAG: ATP-binding cassette domain-containing protein [Armatimonadota bacterium]|nr:ATP-binding cassette domain-containing protein [Armatimonadota bacterium]MDR7444746.1 ATP-binding cassette domain-containing protein [Armatimonadota bacterium]MDR7571193.1 ATP-binding cassette domain-containing protein [Armatimonadota bacterium]MDR7613250.1 ATP-binding cassette domain-containing protein [Armatimonadota bacterium]
MVFYENALGLNEVSLEVRPGEVVGVFGSNGAGKTTLLSTVAGLTLVYGRREQRRGGIRVTVVGSVRLDGQDITEWEVPERVRRGLVLCRERHAVFRDLTVGENLRMGGYLRSAREVEEGIAFACELMPPLRRLWRKPAGMLSGGEQQMVAIGMALVARPRWLLLDEPLLGLSPALQGEIVRTIGDIRGQGVSVVVAEQYARAVLPVVDRGYVLESGALVLSGTREELLDRPEVLSAYFGAGWQR